MSIYSDILFTRYFFTIVLSIVAVIMFLPTFMAFLQCVQNPSDAAKKKRYRRLLWTVAIPLILLAMLYIFDIRFPEITAYDIKIYDDGIEKADGSLIVEAHIHAYDLRNTELMVTAEVNRDYKQENDIDYKNNRGPDPNCLTYDGKCGRSDTLLMHSDNDSCVCRLRIPYKALYHKKGDNSYTIFIYTHYNNNGKWERVYNKDGFHGYTHTFKTSNLKKPVSNSSKSTAKSSNQSTTKQVSQPTKSATKKGPQPIPNSLLGITLGDSKDKVRNILKERGVLFFDHGNSFHTFRYYPTLYHYNFHSIEIYFDASGVEGIFLDEYFKGDTPLEWMNVYEEIKNEMTKQYGNYKSLTPGFFSLKVEMEGTGIFFESPTNDYILLLCGGYPESGKSGYNVGEVGIALFKKSH